MRLHVHTFGDPAGAPLACLHGLTGTGERFRKLGDERLASRRVVAPDLRGHGRSGEELEDRSYASEEEAIEDMQGDGMFFHAPREMLEEEARTNLVRGDDGRLRYRYSRPAAIGAWSEMARAAPPVADVPTLIVMGERSPLAVDVSRHPAAEAVTVPGGHSVLWDAFEETANALEGFL